MKLLFENWRKFVNEVEGEQLPLPGMEGEIEPNDPEGISEKYNIYPGIAKKLLKMKAEGLGLAIYLEGDSGVASFYELDQFGPDSPDPDLMPRWIIVKIKFTFQPQVTTVKLIPRCGRLILPTLNYIPVWVRCCTKQHLR